MRRKIQRRSFLSEIIVSELVALNFSLLTREYSSSAVNVLTNTLKILHRTNVDFFRLNYVQIDQ